MRAHFSHAHLHHGQICLALLASSAIILVTFDMWMSRCGFKTFFLVVKIVDDEWFPWDIMVGIFEVVDSSRVALAEVIKQLLTEFGLID